MSLDLYVHCKSATRMTTEQLCNALTACGINVAIFEDPINYKPAALGPITSCIVLGWVIPTFDSCKLSEILNAGDKEHLGRLFANESLAYANVYTYEAAEHYAAFGDDYLTSLADDIDRHFAECLKFSRTVYEIQTSAGRSDLSWRFQMAVCRSIAETMDGLIEEPQCGDYFFPDVSEQYFRRFAE